MGGAHSPHRKRTDVSSELVGLSIPPGTHVLEAACDVMLVVLAVLAMFSGDPIVA